LLVVAIVSNENSPKYLLECITSEITERRHASFRTKNEPNLPVMLQLISWNIYQTNRTTSLSSDAFQSSALVTAKKFWKTVTYQSISARVATFYLK